MEIRDMKEEDITRISDIDKECFDIGEWYDIEAFTLMYESSPYNFVSFDEHGINGYILCVFDDEKLCIVSLAVEKKSRKKGIGRNLLTHLIKKIENCDTIDKPLIVLQVRPSNAIANKLYKSVGFTFAEILPKYYDCPIEDGHELHLKIDGQ